MPLLVDTHGDWTRIWCPQCEVSQLLRTETTSSLLGRQGLDLVCEKCHFIIATLHDKGES